VEVFKPASTQAYWFTNRDREGKWGDSERHYIWKGGRQETIFPVLKVPRQCSLVLLIEVMHMIGIIF
jgi:hypothetical protein